MAGAQPQRGITSGAKGPESQAMPIDAPAPLAPDDHIGHAVARLNELNKEIPKSHPSERVFHCRYRAYRMQVTSPFDQVDPATGRRTQVKGLAVQFKPDSSVEGGPGVFRVKECQAHKNGKVANCNDCHYSTVIQAIENNSAYSATGGNMIWDAHQIQSSSRVQAEEQAIAVLKSAPASVRSRLYKELGGEFTTLGPSGESKPTPNPQS